MIGSKSEHNPIISGADRDPTQSYPPTVIAHDGRYIAVTKTEARDLVGFESPDGIHFHQSHSYVLKTDPYSWDSERLSSPLLREVSDGNELVLYYAGQTSASEQWVGYAVAGHEGFEKAAGSPMITSSDFSRLGDYDMINLSDVIRVEGTYHFLGSARGPDGSILWRGHGDSPYSVGSIDIMFHTDDFGTDGILQAPSLICVDDTYILQFTMGQTEYTLDERRIYALGGEKLWNFIGEPVCILRPGPTGSWDERRVYAAQWLKCQDGTFTTPQLNDRGKIVLYYSGHDLGHLDIPTMMKNLHAPSIGSVRGIDDDPLWKLNLRFLITKLRRKTPFLFNYNRGMTGLVTYDPDELVDLILQD